MNKKILTTGQACKKILKFALYTVVVITEFASDSRRPRRYSVMKAQELYDDGLISDAEYARCIYGSD